MRYEIKGESYPVLFVYLDRNQSIKVQNGGMSWMTENMKMITSSDGGLGKMFGRAFTGEAMFQNEYVAETDNQYIAIASSLPGEIKVFDIGETSIIAQKSAYLARTPDVEMSVHVNKKFGVGLVGGEGFLMQKFEGRGLLFLEMSGSIFEYDLMPGERLIVDTGSLAAMESTVTLEVKSVGGLKNSLFGGEGFFNTHLIGPGKVWLQTEHVQRAIITGK